MALLLLTWLLWLLGGVPLEAAGSDRGILWDLLLVLLLLPGSQQVAGPEHWPSVAFCSLLVRPGGRRWCCCGLGRGKQRRCPLRRRRWRCGACCGHGGVNVGSYRIDIVAYDVKNRSVFPLYSARHYAWKPSVALQVLTEQGGHGFRSRLSAQHRVLDARAQAEITACCQQRALRRQARAAEGLRRQRAAPPVHLQKQQPISGMNK